MISRYFKIALLLLAPLVYYGQQKPLHSDPRRSIDVYFKYTTTKILQTEKQLDSIFVLVDSLIQKYKMVVVVPFATSEELKKDPTIDYKRAEVIIKYFTKRHNIEGMVFLIRPSLRESIYDLDSYLDKKPFVNFFPLKLRYSGEE